MKRKLPALEYVGAEHWQTTTVLRHGCYDWLPLVRAIRDLHMLGITRIGKWIVEASGASYFVEGAEVFRCWVFMEEGYREFCTRLKMSLQNLSVDVSIANSFPAAEVAGSGLTSGSEHWARCAVSWAEDIADSVLIPKLEVLAAAEWATQATRHRARRVAGRLRRPRGDRKNSLQSSEED